MAQGRIRYIRLWPHRQYLIFVFIRFVDNNKNRISPDFSFPTTVVTVKTEKNNNLFENARTSPDLFFSFGAGFSVIHTDYLSLWQHDALIHNSSR